MTDFKKKYFKYKIKYLDLKPHTGGAASVTSNSIQYGYVIKEKDDIRNFNNSDLFDTFNQPALENIFNGDMEQKDVNLHLLTGILTLNTKIKKNQELLKLSIKELERAAESVKKGE